MTDTKALARMIEPAFLSPPSGPVAWTDKMLLAVQAQAEALAQSIISSPWLAERDAAAFERGRLAGIEEERSRSKVVWTTGPAACDSSAH